jgi:hypothetical protein
MRKHDKHHCDSAQSLNIVPKFHLTGAL